MDQLGRVHLNGLRAVETVGRLGTLAKAAEALGVTVGAVSQQILKTERQLGHALFLRTPKGLVLTPFGEQVLPLLQKGFRHLSAAVALAGREGDGELTVSVPPVLAANWLVSRLSGFTENRPDLAIRIDATVSLVDLDDGSADVAIRVGEGPWPDVRATKLVDQLIFPICSPGNAAKLRTPADLAQLSIITDGNTRVPWSAWLAPFGLDESLLRRGVVFSDSSLCLEAVIAGHGVMLAWQTLAEDALRSGRVVAPFPDLIPTGASYWFVASANRPLRPVEQAFRSWLAGLLAPLSEEPFGAFLRSRPSADPG